MMLKIQLCITEINYILKYIQIEIKYFKLQYYFTVLMFYCIFDQTNGTLLSIIGFFSKHKKCLLAPYLKIISIFIIFIEHI